jgi:hypothetical protein
LVDNGIEDVIALLLAKESEDSGNSGNESVWDSERAVRVWIEVIEVRGNPNRK